MMTTDKMNRKKLVKYHHQVHLQLIMEQTSDDTIDKSTETNSVIINGLEEMIP